jgi:hypothetical protein
VELRVEADQIGAQQAVEQFALPRTDPESLRVRPWNVPEDRDTGVRPPFFQEPWQQGEVVVLHEHNRMLGRVHLLDHGVCEFPVDCLVLSPVVRTKGRACVSNMAKRPEPLVRQSLVVTFLFFIRQPDAAERVAWMLRGDTHAILLVGDGPVRISRPVGDPRAFARQQDGLHRRYQTARRHEHRDTRLAQHVHIRFAIGHHEERTAL